MKAFRTFSKQQTKTVSDKKIHKILKRVGFGKSNSYIILKQVRYIINSPEELRFDLDNPLHTSIKEHVENKEHSFYILRTFKK